MQKTIAIIGAGAAGCFCAIEIKRRNPSLRVVVFEANHKAMQKLAITGGGRCNLTNSFEEINSLSEAYPRGDKLLRRLFYEFNHNNTMEWFENEGIRLVIQDDCCVFPASQDALQIVNTLYRLMRENGVELVCDKRLVHIDLRLPRPEGLAMTTLLTDYTTGLTGFNCNEEREACNDYNPSLRTERSGVRQSQANITKCDEVISVPYILEFSDNTKFYADYVVVTVGGTKQKAIKTMLPPNIEITPTVPSLFPFKIPNSELKALTGAVVPNAQLGLVGTKFRSNGALLITDWGVSGPATLKLSSYAANYLATNSYNASLIINWLNLKEDKVRELLNNYIKYHSKKLIYNIHPESLSERLWKLILSIAGLSNPNLRYADLGSKGINRLVETLCASTFPIQGRAAFKEEFVTCGGVALSEIKTNSLESKKYPGLFFAGEILDIDAITGGFNLQAAWTTAYIVAKNIRG